MDGGIGHRTVLLQEAVEGLAPVSEGVYVDATFGGGGHSRALLAACAPKGQVIALDRDPSVIPLAQAVMESHPGRFRFIEGRFGDLSRHLDQLKIRRVHGILFDLGVSSMQLDQAERGFSFQQDGPLDMRMAGEGPTAADLVASLSERELADLFFRYGEEPAGRRIARAIVTSRQEEPLRTTADLVRIVLRSGHGGGRIHPATRVFQALRIAVNQELDQVTAGVEQALDRLVPGGRVAVISFHSLEDRIVKEIFRRRSTPPAVGRRQIPSLETPRLDCRVLTRKPLLAKEEEVVANPRARSARLRVAERLEEGSGVGEKHE